MVAAWGKRGEEKKRFSCLKSDRVWESFEHKKKIYIYIGGSVGSVGSDPHPKPTEPGRSNPFLLTHNTRHPTRPDPFQKFGLGLVGFGRAGWLWTALISTYVECQV